MGAIPVCQIIGWRTVDFQERLRPQREDVEKARDGSTVVVEVVEAHVGMREDVDDEDT
jgi:hypothetical protein